MEVTLDLSCTSKVQNEADNIRVSFYSSDAANICKSQDVRICSGNSRNIWALPESAYSGGAYSIEKEQSEADERIFVLNELSVRVG